MEYAVIKTGGKQYRAEVGQSLLVERRPEDVGAQVQLEPLLFRSADQFLTGSDVEQVTVSAKVIAHERGDKLRVFKFKPKRGYSRRTGHRQEVTRLQVTEVKVAAAKPKVAAQKSEESSGA